MAKCHYCRSLLGLVQSNLAFATCVGRVLSQFAKIALLQLTKMAAEILYGIRRGTSQRRDPTLSSSVVGSKHCNDIQVRVIRALREI